MPLGAIPFPFGICRICKDRATGVHYGVTTCEGCKGFFKRSITRGDKYKCFFGSDCDLTPKNRNRCKSCRFRKCLEVGMSVEAVRMGRIPKVEKEKALEVFHQGGSDFKNIEIEVEMTGTGSYDFKINPKDNTENKYPQTGLQGQIPQRLIKNGRPEIQSDCSQTFDTNFEKPENSKEGMPSLMEHDQHTSMNLSNHARVLSSDYHPYLQHNHQNYPSGRRSSSNQVIPTPQSYPSDQGLCHRSSTVTSQEIFHSHSNTSKHFGSTFDNGTAQEQYAYVARKQQDNFKVPFDSFTTHDATYVSQGTNYEQNQSNKFASDSHRYHLNFDSNVMRAPCGNPNFRSPTCSSISGQGIHEKSGTQTGTVGGSQIWQQFDTSEQHCVNTAVGQLRLNSGMDARAHNGYNEQNQEFLNQNGPDLHNKTLSYMPAVTVKQPCPDPWYGFTRGSVTNGNDNDIDYGMKPEQRHTESLSFNVDESVHHNSVKSSVRLGSFEKLLQDKSTNDFNTKSVNDSQSRLLKTDTSDQSESINDYKWSSAGSVISREGSNSSQRSGYSSAIIQILLDQLIESNQVSTFANNLKKKLDTGQADVVEKLLKLVDNVSERSKHSSENKSLSELPENKLECMNRFLKDLNSADVKTEAPLLKKKRCIEDANLKESFENMDVQVPMEVFTSNQNLERSDDCAQRVPNPQVSQQCGTSHVSKSSQENSSPLNVPFNSQTKFKTSANQNPANSNYQQTLTNDVAQNSVQNVSTNSIAQSRSFTNSVEQMLFDRSAIFDNIVSSTVGVEDKTETSTESEVKMLATISGMNLAMKILNRFKPEHREKIRLFKQGQLHIQILTDSDEDCAAIYKKLMDGISGLNDRILGFCESVPGFLDICKEDREKLVKRSYYDMWTLSYSEYFQNGESFWILPSGEIYSAQAMRKILNDEMVDTIMTFADSYNKLELSDLETALFSAVRLTTTSTEIELENLQNVEELHSHLLNTLAFEIKRNHPGNHMHLLMNMFKLVPLIESINRIQSQIIANFSVKRFSKMADAADENKT